MNSQFYKQQGCALLPTQMYQCTFDFISYHISFSVNVIHDYTRLYFYISVLNLPPGSRWAFILTLFYSNPNPFLQSYL